MALFLGVWATDATGTDAGPYALVGVVAVGALWWRRRVPLAVAAVTFVAGALAPLAGGAAIVSVYTVAAHRGLEPTAGSVALSALYVMSVVVGVARFRDPELGVAGDALASVVMTAAAYGWGVAVRARRELLGAFAERAERAEADQLARTAEARRAERVRIAGEMHDVLAHRLSLLSLHAGAIELRPGARPEDLAAAAQVVRSTAHLALDDLRAVIGVMRDGPGGDLAPPPAGDDVHALVTECRTAGMHVEVVGTMPAGPLGRHAYEVVREALTNARKHAPGQPVRLGLAGDAARGLRIEIVNPVDAAAPARAAIPGAGVGLIGLRERVELAGGRLDHGIDGGGTHHVEAWLPWLA